jgi:DNA-binding response OmpR family regulator
MKNSYKILLVDNEMQRLADVYSKLLLKEYQLDVTVDWDEVKNRVKRFKPELIIIKSDLPKFDGTVLCQSVKMAYNIPVILLVDKNASTPMRIDSCNADAILEKPVDAAKLFQLVKEFEMRRNQAAD